MKLSSRTLAGLRVASGNGFSPRRVWYAMDSHFARDPKIDWLRRRHRAAAICVPVVLLGEAKRHNDHGWFEIGWAQLAELAGLSEARVTACVDAMQEVGLLELHKRTPIEFVGKFVAWDSWQRTGQASMRKQNQRAGDDG